MHITHFVQMCAHGGTWHWRSTNQTLDLTLDLKLNDDPDSLSIEQMPITVLKTGLEKHALSLKVMPFGRHKFKGLCCGMKSSLASAWMPYFSKVQAVRSNHRCFCSHHNAWSDQSRLISADTRHKDAEAAKEAEAEITFSRKGCTSWTLSVKVQQGRNKLTF